MCARVYAYVYTIDDSDTYTYDITLYARVGIETYFEKNPPSKRIERKQLQNKTLHANVTVKRSLISVAVRCRSDTETTITLIITVLAW